MDDQFDNFMSSWSDSLEIGSWMDKMQTGPLMDIPFIPASGQVAEI